MNRETLEKPFDNTLIKNRKGAFGQKLSYVEGVEYIRRLNDAFESKWSIEIVSHEVLGREMVVLCKLTAGGVVKMAFGGSPITTNRDTGEIVSQADDLKAAATDALKKACSLLGIGLHLYCNTTCNGNSSGSTGKSSGANGQSHRDNGNSRQPRLTQKQLSAIWGMGRALGLTADAIRDHSQQEFGVFPEFLTKSDASTFIGKLNQKLNGNGDTR